MKTIKILLVTCLILILNVNTKAQDYNGNTTTTDYGRNQLGIRFGDFSGLDYQHIFNRNVGLRLDLLQEYPFGRGLVEGLAQKNLPVKNSGLVFSLGVGAFLTSQYGNRVYISDYPYERVYNYSPLPGITGMAGLDFYIPRSRIVIGVDIRPRLSIYGDDLWDGGVSGRFIF